MKVVCPKCKSRIKVGDKHLGKTGKCPKCATAFKVPSVKPASKSVEASPSVSAETTSAATKKANVLCALCDNKFNVPTDWLGELVTCPGCSSVIKAVRFKSPQSPPAKRLKQANLVPFSESNVNPTSAHQQPAQLQPLSKDPSGTVAANATTESKSKKQESGLLIGALIALASVAILGLLVTFLVLRSGGEGQVTARGEPDGEASQRPVNENPDPEKAEAESTSSTESPNEAVDSLKKAAEPASTFFPDWSNNDPDFPEVRLPEGKLTYGARAGMKYGYHHELLLATPGFKTESKLDCDVVYHVASQNVSGESTLHQTSIATGLGMPGNRIAVGTQLIQGAEKIRVIKDGQTYNAKIIRKISDSPLTLLQVDGILDFAPPRISAYDEIDSMQQLLRHTGFGVWESRPVRPAKAHFKDEYHDWGWAHRFSWAGSTITLPSGITYDHRGQVTGFVLWNDKSKPEIFHASGLAHAMLDEPNTIDTKSMPESWARADIERQVKKNLVQVAVDRHLEPSGFQTLKVESEIQLGVRDLVSPPVLFPFEKLSYSGSLNLHPHGTIPRAARKRLPGLVSIEKHTEKKQILPGLLGALADQPFVTLGEPGQSTWTTNRAIQVYSASRGGMLAVQQISEEDRNKTIGGIQTDHYVVLKADENSATIRRRIDLVAADTNAFDSAEESLNLYGVRQNELKGYSPVIMRAEQMLEFDLRTGMVTSSRLKGELRINPEVSRVNRFNLELISTAMSDNELKVFVHRPPQIKPQKTVLRSLKEIEANPRTSIIKGLDGDPLARNRAVRRLVNVIPEPNETISKWLATQARLPESFETATSWILEKHIPLFVETRLKTHRFEPSLLDLRIVERHPGFDKVEELLEKSLQSPTTFIMAVRLLRTKYAGLSEKLLLPILEGVTASDGKTKSGKSYINEFLSPGNFHMIWCLRDTGTSASLPVLENFREEFNLRVLDSPSKDRQLDSIDKTIEFIEKRTSD